MSNASGRKSKPPVGLISLVAVSAVGLAATFLILSEAGTHGQCDASLEAIGNTIGKRKVSRKEIGKFIQGDPDRTRSKDKSKETFTWTGMFGSYGFQVEYDSYDDIRRIKPL